MQSEVHTKKLKACPVVVRDSGHGLEVLVFRHPLAGVQLVKGTVEPGEAVVDAALRELEEESGVTASHVVKDLGLWESDFNGQIWHFVLCNVGELTDTWNHYTQDDGGHVFSFFWHPLQEPPTSEWHDVFVRAFHTIKSRL